MKGNQRAHARHRRLRAGLQASAWLGLCWGGAVDAAEPEAPAGYDVFGDWPTHITTGDGTDIGLAVLYQFDLERFSHDNKERIENIQTNRRKYYGFYARKTGVYDAIVQYDTQAKVWADAFVRFNAKGVTGIDAGNFRFGYSKTPVGFEGVTSSAATTFIELALPSQAIWEGRRAGVDWAWVRPHYVINLGWYFWHKDLDGNNPGRTVAGRAAWVPINKLGHTLHLGVSASRESLDWSQATSNSDVAVPPTARLRARPETGLSPVRLIDSGALTYSDHIDRQGLEALWINGPVSLQGEYLSAQVAREGGRPDFDTRGYYVFATWTLTGEARYYSDGNVADRRYRGRDLSVIRPNYRWGAVELALRYSRLSLDDGAITGGIEHDWTFGANWYLGEHLKLQANYIWAKSDHGNLKVDPRIFEMRAQIVF